jgi:hypothetical protein
MMYQTPAEKAARVAAYAKEDEARAKFEAAWAKETKTEGSESGGPLSLEPSPPGAPAPS